MWNGFPSLTISQINPRKVVKLKVEVSEHHFQSFTVLHSRIEADIFIDRLNAFNKITSYFSTTSTH